MNKQDVNPLQESVKELMYVFGYEVDENLSDEELYEYLQELTTMLALVCKLIRLNLKTWKEACKYVGNLRYGEVLAELQLSDNALIQKFGKGYKI